MNSIPNMYRLYVFQIVAQKESFSIAAKVLHTSQPNISKHIRLLEQELGIELINRQGGRIYLTEAGRAVLKTTERLLDQVDTMHQTLQDIQGGKRGVLRLIACGIPGLYLLPSVLTEFNQRYPEVEISLALGNNWVVIESILNNQIDIGLLEDHQPVPGLQMQPWIKDQLVLAAGSSNPLVEQNKITIEDLKAQLFLVREDGSRTKEQMERALVLSGLDSVRKMELTSSEGVKRGIAAGLGISLVSLRSIEAEMKNGEIEILNFPDLFLDRMITIVTQKEKRQSIAALTFLGQIYRSGMQ